MDPVPRSHSGRGAPQSCPLTSHTFWGTYMFCGTHMPTLSLTHTACTQYPFPCFSCLSLRGPKSWLRMVGHRRRGRACLQTWPGSVLPDHLQGSSLRCATAEVSMLCSSPMSRESFQGTLFPMPCLPSYAFSPSCLCHLTLP